MTIIEPVSTDCSAVHCHHLVEPQTMSCWQLKLAVQSRRWTTKSLNEFNGGTNKKKTAHLGVNTAIELNLATPAHNSQLKHTPLDEDNADIVGCSCCRFELNRINSKWAIFGFGQYCIQWVTYTDLRQESSTGPPSFVGECYYTGFWTEYCGVDLPDLGRDGPIEVENMVMNLPTPRNPLPVTLAIKKIPAFYDTWSYITAFTGAGLSAVKCIHSSPYFFKIHINIILTCTPRLLLRLRNLLHVRGQVSCPKRNNIKCIGKAIPVQVWRGPRELQKVTDPRLQGNWRVKVVRLSALCTGHLYPPPPQGNIPAIHFCRRLSRSQEHSAAGRIKSTNNSDDPIGIRNCDLPPCSAVNQPTVPPRATDNNTGVYNLPSRFM